MQQKKIEVEIVSIVVIVVVPLSINFSQIEDGGWKVGNEDRGKGI